MIRMPLILPLAALPLCLLSAQSPHPSQQQLRPVAGCCNLWLHEPFLVYDVAGSTIAGPVYKHLAVYDDGHAIMAETTYAPDPGRAATAVLTPAEVQTLHHALIAAGAYQQCDDGAVVSDVPLTTVTVLRGTTEAAAHSYSYLTPNASQDAVQQVISSFVAAKFPGF